MAGRRRIAWLGAGLVLMALAPGHEADRSIGQSYQIPYQLTQTNHYLIRVRVNGKGPFNFLVDTGAPALYIGTEAAKKIGLVPSPDEYWTQVEQLELEGGASLKKVKARVENPYQLEGMNALGLPGASIDGILGFTILARFRMEFDPTKDRLTWTRLDYEPKDPAGPRRGEQVTAPAELQLMNAFGPLAKVAALLVGKQPEEEVRLRGFLGAELKEVREHVQVVTVFGESPAEKAGIRPGDILTRVNGKEVRQISAVREATAKIQPGTQLELVIHRGPGVMKLVTTVAEGL
jgi:serine protease Do